jgi:hypothetical protein
MSGPSSGKKRGKRAQQQAPASAAPAAAAGAGTQSVNDWLHGLARAPRTIVVFDHQWAFKAPTAELATQWDDAIANVSVRAALALVMHDQRQATPDDDPGTAAADRFLAVAAGWGIPDDAFIEFWQRLAGEVFGPGEPSAS